MLLELAGFAVLHTLFLLLYVTNNSSFPKPLSKEEERRCLLLAAEGDQAAKNMLIEHNLRLVAHIIKKYYSTSRDQEDLLSIGTIGLIKAINSFDVQKGAKLATYASRCIENEILMHFRAQKKGASDVSLNKEIDCDKDGNSLSLLDVLSCDDTLIDDVALKLKVEKLYTYINTVLSNRERRIIILRYGLNGLPPKAQREVAAELGISRSYVSRIEKKALETLRASFECPGRHS